MARHTSAEAPGRPPAAGTAAADARDADAPAPPEPAATGDDGGATLRHAAAGAPPPAAADTPAGAAAPASGFADTGPAPLPLPLRPDASSRHDEASAAAPAEADLFPFLDGPRAAPRRDHPALRPALALAASLLALALAAQAVVQWRDAIAARLPGTRPAIDALCLAAGCSVAPLRRLDDVSIEGSEWNPAPSGGAAQLVVVLKNAGGVPVALPWVELTLTEVNGALLARRALAPGDFAGAPATLAPAAEVVLRATLAVEGRPPAGYTVALFHP